MGNVRFLHVAVLLKIGGEFFVLWVNSKKERLFFSVE